MDAHFSAFDTCFLWYFGVGTGYVCHNLSQLVRNVRSTINQEQLNNLASMSIKRKELEAINWDQIINNFAEA